MVKASRDTCIKGGPAKISVIGVGHVGATFAYALLLSGIAVEVVLVDKDRARATSEALDLAHALPFRMPASVRAGHMPDTAGSHIVVIAAGPNQHHGESRLDLAARNAVVVREVAAGIAEHSPQAIIVVATNPVDIIARLAQETSGFPPESVIGSGTILDTARLRHLVGQHFRVDPRSVDAQMIGEHGDSAVAIWSLANVAGVPLAELARMRGVSFAAAVKERIAGEVRNAAYAIIAGKGATYYAIASGLVRIIEAILCDQKAVLTVSNAVGRAQRLPELEGVWLSLPCIVGRGGLEQTLALDLSPDERANLLKSGEILRATKRGIPPT